MPSIKRNYYWKTVASLVKNSYEVLEIIKRDDVTEHSLISNNGSDSIIVCL